jgi:hypothetical protein
LKKGRNYIYDLCFPCEKNSPAKGFEGGCPKIAGEKEAVRKRLPKWGGEKSFGKAG